MQARGRLYTSLCEYTTRDIQSVSTNRIIVNSTANILADTLYKPFLIQGNNVTRILAVISASELEVENTTGFIAGACYTPWANRWTHKFGDKATVIANGDLVVGPHGDVFQVIDHYNHGVKTSVLALWQVGVSKEPTSANVVIFTPTSQYHLLPRTGIESDLEGILVNDRLDNLSNVLLDDSVREDIWAKVSHFTRDLFIDISSGWYGPLRINEQFNIPVNDNTLNYVELNSSGVVVINTTGWNPPNLKVAEIRTLNGVIQNIKQVWVKTKEQPQQEQKITEFWKVNQRTIEIPDGVITEFTLPNFDTYLTTKLKVYINGVNEDDLTEITNTKFRINGNPLYAGDKLTIDYAQLFTGIEIWKVNQKTIETPDGVNTVFSLIYPNESIYGKLKIYINGVNEDDFEQLSLTTFRINGNPLYAGDKLTVDFAYAGA